MIYYCSRAKGREKKTFLRETLFKFLEEQGRLLSLHQVVNNTAWSRLPSAERTTLAIQPLNTCTN